MNLHGRKYGTESCDGTITNQWQCIQNLNNVLLLVSYFSVTGYRSVFPSMETRPDKDKGYDENNFRTYLILLICVFFN